MGASVSGHRGVPQGIPPSRDLGLCGPAQGTILSPCVALTLGSQTRRATVVVSVPAEAMGRNRGVSRAASLWGSGEPVASSGSWWLPPGHVYQDTRDSISASFESHTIIFPPQDP